MQEFEKVRIRALRHEEDEPRLYALAEEWAGDRLAADETVVALTRCDVFVAEHAGEIAGYVAIAEEGTDVCVRQLVVAIGHTERKVADQLCDWVEGYAVSRGFERMSVDCSDEVARVRGFYLRRGYVPARDGRLELALPSLANALDG